jgi:hypothetical protein
MDLKPGRPMGRWDDEITRKPDGQDSMIDMATVRSDLESLAWSRQIGTIEEVRRAISLDGAYEFVRARERVLKPYETAKAPQRSLSAVYGLENQPLHSDGAHLLLPPDVVVLHSELPTPTSTVLWKPELRGGEALPAAARDGIFTVRGNGESFLAVASDHRGLRFDPVVMSPGDAFARETLAFFKDVRSNGHVHSWNEPNVVLFINNRRALHARDKVLDPDTRSVTRIAYRWDAKP